MTDYIYKEILEKVEYYNNFRWQIYGKVISLYECCQIIVLDKKLQGINFNRIKLQQIKNSLKKLMNYIEKSYNQANIS